jgi:hypothetical protein
MMVREIDRKTEFVEATRSNRGSPSSGITGQTEAEKLTSSQPDRLCKATHEVKGVEEND